MSTDFSYNSSLTKYVSEITKTFYQKSNEFKRCNEKFITDNKPIVFEFLDRFLKRMSTDTIPSTNATIFVRSDGILVLYTKTYERFRESANFLTLPLIEYSDIIGKGGQSFTLMKNINFMIYSIDMSNLKKVDTILNVSNLVESYFESSFILKSCLKSDSGIIYHFQNKKQLFLNTFGHALINVIHSNIKQECLHSKMNQLKGYVVLFQGGIVFLNEKLYKRAYTFKVQDTVDKILAETVPEFSSENSCEKVANLFAYEKYLVRNKEITMENFENNISNANELCKQYFTRSGITSETISDCYENHIVIHFTKEF